MAEIMDSFGGEGAEQYNALATSLRNAARNCGEDGSIYNFMEKTPKTSFIVHLVDELWALGYEIKKK